MKEKVCQIEYCSPEQIENLDFEKETKIVKYLIMPNKEALEEEEDGEPVKVPDETATAIEACKRVFPYTNLRAKTL